jgi:hypothetical protein
LDDRKVRGRIVEVPVLRLSLQQARSAPRSSEHRSWCRSLRWSGPAPCPQTPVQPARPRCCYGRIRSACGVQAR